MERSSIQSVKTQTKKPGAGYGSLLQNSGLNWRKVGKTTRPFRYDLNQIPYDTAEVMKRFKGLSLIECLKNYGQKFITVYRRQ